MSDPTEHLLELAADVALDTQTGSVRDFGRQPPFVKPQTITQHPKHQRFIQSLEADPELSRLFPDNDEARGWIRSHRPSSVANQLINWALWTCASKGSVAAGCVRDRIEQGLEDLRRLIRGETISVATYVGFGAIFPANVELMTPWGRLRAWRPSDALLLSGMADTPIPHAGTVLESATDMKWNVLPEGEPGALHVPDIEDERWKRIALAMLLVQPPESARASLPWFCVQAQGLGPDILGGSRRQFVKGPVVAADQVYELAEWITRVADKRLSIIAVDRSISMVGRLVDHVDAFIDGVVVWENLFGTGDNQELVYRVSLNMACVLSDVPAERLALQREIKKLYQLRSRVVHGGKHLTSAEAAATRARAQVLTLRSVRRILAERSNLLGALPDEFLAFVLGVDA